MKIFDEIHQKEGMIINLPLYFVYLNMLNMEVYPRVKNDLGNTKEYPIMHWLSSR